MMIDDYSLLKSIGKGAFGEVYLTSKEGTNRLFATKKVSKKKVNSPTLKKYFFNEISILKEINHKNIIHFETIKHTVHNFYIITEYCNGGGLSDCLLKYKKLYVKPFSEQIVQHIMRQIVEALKYLHGKKIIHRDIKLDNILVNFENEKDKNNLNMLKAQIKMIDFGFSTHLTENDLRYSTLGSPINMDPLLLKKLATTNSVSKLIGYDEKADIWSLGTVCYEMLIGQGIFNAQNMVDLIKKVENGNYHVPTNLSKEVVSFLNGILQYSAKNRLSAEELSRHHFLTKNVKDFKNIDLTKVSNKIDKKGLNINIKRNQSIWAIFKEEDEKTLIDIPGKYLDDEPMKEKDENIQKTENENPFKKRNDNSNKLNDNNKINNTKIIDLNKNTKDIIDNNNIKNNNNINNDIIAQTKEKNIDYNLLKQQQKLYYQLNLKNNNYQRYANYAYNNKYNFNVSNYNNMNNYNANIQPNYHNANSDGNSNINKQIQIPIQRVPLVNNNIVQQPHNKQNVLNPQNIQFQYIYEIQPQFIIQNNQNVQNPLIIQKPPISQEYNQPSTNVQIKNQNIQIEKPVTIPDNNKNNKSNQIGMSNISNATTKTMISPIGSRMPQQEYFYQQSIQKRINLESYQQKHINYYHNQINQNQLQPFNQNKVHVKKLRSETYNEHQNLKINQNINPEMQKIHLQRKDSQYEQHEKRKELSIDKKHKIKTPSKEKENNNDIKKHNKMKSLEESAQIKEPKNNPRHQNTQKETIQSQNVNIIKNKNVNFNANIKENIDNKYNDINNINDFQITNKKNYNSNLKKIGNQQPTKDEKMHFPFDNEYNDINTNEVINNTNDNHYNYKNEIEEFNEPFPMPSDDKSLNEKKISKNITSSDELDNLIEFKLGDELCLDPDSMVKKKSDEFNDSEDDKNLNLPMKKIMEHTVERPTIGVPPPGTDPKDNFNYDEEDNNGIFQSSIKMDFENDNFEEI